MAYELSPPGVQLRPVNIAVIGAGLIGPRHAKSVISNSSAQLVALVDPAPSGPDTAAQLQTQYFSSISTMLSAIKPDAAIVCTPNQTHVPVTKELLSGGVHVLVEKPLSENTENGISLLRHVRLPENSHLKLLVGHHRRFNPYVLKTKHIIDSHSLGRIIAVNGLWTSFKPPEYFEPPGEWRRSRSSGGVVHINAVHDVDILHYLFGPITRVYAESTSQQRENPPHHANEGAAITLRFASGAVGTFLLCDATPSPHSFEAGTGENPAIPKCSEVTGAEFYHVFGSEASLSVPDMRRCSYDGQAQKSWNMPLTWDNFRVEDATPFDLQLAHFVEVVRGQSESSCTCEEGLRALIVCDAIVSSLESGQPVDINVEIDS